MTIRFKVLDVRERPGRSGRNLVQLVPGDWDDYSFKTSFHLFFDDAHGERIDLGAVKIGYTGQPKGWTQKSMQKEFECLPEGWFSLGQDVEYYEKAFRLLNAEDRLFILHGLRDVVAHDELLGMAQNEQVFKDSLTRGVSQSVIHGQFRRVLAGEVVLTDFRFSYRDPGDEKHAPIDIEFKVKALSKPSTNLHVLIGRNGVGKTTLLNNMVSSILNNKQESGFQGQFYEKDIWDDDKELSREYFSSVVSVSFSAFDPFIPPGDRPDRSSGVAYFYIGMKNARSDDANQSDLPPKTSEDLVNDFVVSFSSCISQTAKRERWLTAIKRLESDKNFADMNLGRLLEIEDAAATRAARALAKKMSSGHSIVLLTITKLVDTVEEKTLVLLDEPESHLHPPLLSAFTRALADLMNSRNGVAIIATHSPVVVQEVPKSCVWKLTRLRNQGRSDRPERETFGENVGILTREIFGLEVARSGYHDMLQQEVDKGGTFESITHEYKGQLGQEAQAILLSLISAREVNSERDE